MCPAGTVARVRLIDLPPDEVARLRELGLAPETQVQVIQCGLFKSRVIAIGSDRFAIDGKTCRCIELYDDEVADSAIKDTDAPKATNAVKATNVVKTGALTHAA